MFTTLRARLALLIRKGMLQSALADCINALKNDPEDADVWITKGNIEIALGQRDDGVGSLSKALRNC